MSGAPDYSQFGPVDIQPLSKIQKLGGAYLARNWSAIPHVTHHDEVDIEAVEEFRTELNQSAPDQKLSPLPFLMKSVVAALQRSPTFNASLADDGNSVVLKKYFHLGVAIDTPRGLLVGVVRDVDAKSLRALGAEVASLSEKARGKGLSMAEMTGGCFTISSLGPLGGTSFTPIINAPEVAILGVSRMAQRPFPAASGVAWRRVLPLSLSYDHRIINGADAGRFIDHLREGLREPRQFEP